MKKSIIALLTALIALMAPLATSAQFRWAPTVGAVVSNLHFKQDLFTVNQRTGFSAGAIGELMFPGIGFGIDLGLLYEMRGAHTVLGDKLIWSSQGYDSQRVFLHYLSIPLHLRFKWTRMNGLEDYIAPFVFGGPSFGFLLGHSRIDAFDYSGGDVGLGVGFGLEVFKRWQVSFSHTWGMTYALKTSLLTNLSAQNRQWDIRVAYFF